MKLTVSNLNFNYGDKEILKDLSFESKSSSILSIVGSSGVGKTTIFSILGGFLSPVSGTVVLDDVDITYLKPEQRPIVTMFQEGGLFPHLSIIDNVKFGLKSKFNKNRFKDTDIDQYSEKLLDKVGLHNMYARFPHELSGGQKQRVSLARSIAVRPKVLLLDEPFSALDPTLKYQLNKLLEDIVRTEKIIAIKITHDLDDALLSSDQIMLIQDNHSFISSPETISSGKADINLLSYFKSGYQLNNKQLVLAKDIHVVEKSESIDFFVASVRSVGHMYEYLLTNEFGSIKYLCDALFSHTVTLYYDPESIMEFKI
jgi:ABC-type Fe3+/spermidine/putrescine transport system ATPase subunit